MAELLTRHGSPQEATGADSKGHPVWTHKTACKRCGGAGFIDGYRHVEGGRCFECGGSGRGSVVSERLYTAEEIAKLNATAAKRAATKVARQQREAAKAEAAREMVRQQRAEALEADPFFQRLCRYADEHHTFLADLCDKMRLYDLTEAQIAAAEEAMAKIDARKALIKSSSYVGDVGSRIEIAGTVDFCRCIHEAEGYYDRSRYLIKIKLDDGNIATWFTGESFRVGERLVGKVTVKDHNSYQGVKETVIKNPRWVEVARDRERCA